MKKFQVTDNMVGEEGNLTADSRRLLERQTNYFQGILNVHDSTNDSTSANNLYYYKHDAYNIVTINVLHAGN